MICLVSMNKFSKCLNIPNITNSVFNEREKSVLLFFINKNTAGETLNEEKYIKDSHFQGKPENFISCYQIQ